MAAPTIHTPIKGTAQEFADDWWWDEEYHITTKRGRARWETCAMTSGGRRIRLMRIDDKTDIVCRCYVKPSTVLYLVKKL